MGSISGQGCDTQVVGSSLSWGRYERQQIDVSFFLALPLSLGLIKTYPQVRSKERKQGRRAEAAVCQLSVQGEPLPRLSQWLRSPSQTRRDGSVL